jgi:hypothetical protein
MKQGVWRGIQLIKTDNKHNIDRYPGKSDDNMQYCVRSGYCIGVERASKQSASMPLFGVAVDLYLS